MSFIFEVCDVYRWIAVQFDCMPFTQPMQQFNFSTQWVLSGGVSEQVRENFTTVSTIMQSEVRVTDKKHRWYELQNRLTSNRSVHWVIGDTSARSISKLLKYMKLTGTFDWIETCLLRDQSICRHAVADMKEEQGFFQNPHWGVNPQQTCNTPKLPSFNGVPVWRAP
jgi:hypothetical protein